MVIYRMISPSRPPETSLHSLHHKCAIIAFVNSSSLRRNDHHFADDIFKCIFVSETFCISIRISLKLSHKGPIDNKSALVQVMAWCRIRDKPSPERMLTLFVDAYMRHWGWWFRNNFLFSKSTKLTSMSAIDPKVTFSFKYARLLLSRHVLWYSPGIVY